MNMAAQAGGMNAGALYQMGAAGQQAPQNAAPQATAAQAGGWTCSCGATGNTGKFCSTCGKPRPQSDSWTCSCGTENTGKFCQNCGKPRPNSATFKWKCDKCGWEPEDPNNIPRFCPNCGDPFNEQDKVTT
ncbi:MAG: SPFH domain-containing protein, partial [Lachnospiraceae bacterium]|nr:SPFH domain-containing protein [Lachnospiraceae bacterium]